MARGDLSDESGGPTSLWDVFVPGLLHALSHDDVEGTDGFDAPPAVGLLIRGVNADTPEDAAATVAAGLQGNQQAPMHVYPQDAEMDV